MRSTLAIFLTLGLLIPGCGGDSGRAGKNAIVAAPRTGPSAITADETIWLADRQWSRGEIDRARETLTGILESTPDSFPARYRLGVLMVPTAAEAALEHLERAAALAPLHPGPPAFLGLARTLFSDFETARRDMTASLARAESSRGYGLRDTSETVRRGIDALHKANFRLARNAFRQAADNDSTNAVLWHLLARADLELGDRPAAVRASARALALRPDLREAQVVLGLAHFRQGQFAEAGALRDGLLAASPAPASAYYLDGLLQQADSNYRDAALSLWLAALEDPLVPEYHGALGQILMRMSLVDLAGFHMLYVETVRAFLGRAWERPGYGSG